MRYELITYDVWGNDQDGYEMKEIHRSEKPDSTGIRKALDVITKGGQGSGRKPHEMTRAEFHSEHGKPKKNTTVTGGFDSHKDAVETALNRGLSVSDHVLKDYPEFKRSVSTALDDLIKGDAYENSDSDQKADKGAVESKDPEPKEDEGEGEESEESEDEAEKIED